MMWQIQRGERPWWRVLLMAWLPILLVIGCVLAEGWTK
jgi:hypothetical protein